MNRRSLLGLLASTPLLATRAVAQAYPGKPIHIVVSVTAGGSIDTIARSYGEALSQALGQSVVIENKPGANGNIAAAAVARAAPDGHTLLATGGSTLNLNPFLYASLPFDPVKSFAPVCLTARTNFILVVHPKLGVDTVEAFIALAKAKPRTLNYGSAGSGSLIQIASELFNTTAGIETNHVPYKGLAPAVIRRLVMRRLSNRVMPFVRLSRAQTSFSCVPGLAEALPPASFQFSPKRRASPERWSFRLLPRPSASRVAADPDRLPMPLRSCRNIQTRSSVSRMIGWLSFPRLARALKKRLQLPTRCSAPASHH